MVQRTAPQKCSESTQISVTAVAAGFASEHNTWSDSTVMAVVVVMMMSVGGGGGGVTGPDRLETSEFVAFKRIDKVFCSPFAPAHVAQGQRMHALEITTVPMSHSRTRRKRCRRWKQGRTISPKLFQ